MSPADAQILELNQSSIMTSDELSKFLAKNDTQEQPNDANSNFPESPVENFHLSSDVFIADQTRQNDFEREMEFELAQQIVR